jgi:excisionase family DNA binding protein
MAPGIERKVPSVERQALSVSEFSHALGTSNDTTRRRIADGSIRSVRYGRRVLIPRTELDRVLAEGCGLQAGGGS